MTRFIFSIFILIPFMLFSQQTLDGYDPNKDSSESNVEDEAIEELGNMPDEWTSFKGGDEAMYRYIVEYLVYPNQAINEGIEGKVFVGFTVLADGSLADAFILRGIGGGCDVEALRLVESMPTWIPAKMRGNPVSISHTVPIQFTLPTKRLVNPMEHPIENGIPEKAIHISKSDSVLSDSSAPLTELKVIDEVVFGSPEILASFPGGDDSLYCFISRTLEYPITAIEEGIEGKVFTQFIIEPSGKITNIKVLNGIGGGCDEEALRVFSLMPDWIPASNRGVPITTEQRLAITFNMESRKKR